MLAGLFELSQPQDIPCWQKPCVAQRGSVPLKPPDPSSGTCFSLSLLGLLVDTEPVKHGNVDSICTTYNARMIKAIFFPAPAACYLRVAYRSCAPHGSRSQRYSSKLFAGLRAIPLKTSGVRWHAQRWYERGADEGHPGTYQSKPQAWRRCMLYLKYL